MKYVEDEQIKAAFVRMIAKLHVGQAVVIRPFMMGLLGEKEKKEALNKVADLGAQIDQCNDQQQILVRLMHTGYLEPEVYYQEKHDLDVQIAELTKEKEQLSGSLKGDLKHMDAAGKLLRAVSKTVSPEFNGELFEEVVETATIISRETIRFNLKCGLQLEERLVKA